MNQVAINGNQGKKHDEVDEDPPFSRLFVLGDKRAVEEDYIEEFSKVGTVQYVKPVRDRKSGDPKGLVYIKMSKTSEAARAVEELNGCTLRRLNRPIKVLIASNRSSEANQTDEEIIAQLSRLFVIVPKTDSEDEIREKFEEFGKVSKVLVIKDKGSGQSKGLAYVTFAKASQAALAFEQCDPAYKPKFADPVTRKRQYEDLFGNEREEFNVPPISHMHPGPRPIPGPMEFLSNFPHSNQKHLLVKVSRSVTQMQLMRLFNIVPTLEYCKSLNKPFGSTDSVVVKYSSSSCCAYAKEALSGFEYPPGYPLEVDFHYPSDNGSMGFGSKPRNSGSSNSATKESSQMSPVYRSASYFSDPTLPPAQPMVDTRDVAKRLFIVTQPERLPTPVLQDLFCRFGNLIYVSYMPGKNCGFAKFASEESANAAQQRLHAYEIMGIRLKVLDAEDPPGEPLKKVKKQIDSD